MNDPRTPAGLAASGLEPVRDLSGLIDALRATAAERDREGGHASREKQWIADAGLLTLAVPQEFGGAGAHWPRIYDVIRAIARVDSALAHLLGFQCLQVVSVDVWAMTFSARDTSKAQLAKNGGGATQSIRSTHDWLRPQPAMAAIGSTARRAFAPAHAARR